MTPPPDPAIPWGLVAVVALGLLFAAVDWLRRRAGRGLPPSET